MSIIPREPVQLSPREQSVAELYSRGFSAGYVAAKLFISKRTVEVHVRHIYEKLGVRSRDELIERFGGWL